jgi:hypothetical protein
MAKLLCPIHGYFDASEGSCPICSPDSGHPQAPPPLGDEGATMIGNNAGFDSADDITEMGGQYLGGMEGTGATQLGRAQKEGVTEIEFKDEGPVALLWVKEGPRRGQTFKIKDNTVLGRSSGDILVDDPKASSSHAKFTYEDEKFHIWDFGTPNGTHVNGERIRAATPLEENDEIKIGGMVFILKIL